MSAPLENPAYGHPLACCLRHCTHEHHDDPETPRTFQQCRADYLLDDGRRAPCAGRDAELAAQQQEDDRA